MRTSQTTRLQHPIASLLIILLFTITVVGPAVAKTFANSPLFSDAVSCETMQPSTNSLLENKMPAHKMSHMAHHKTTSTESTTKKTATEKTSTKNNNCCDQQCDCPTNACSFTALPSSPANNERLTAQPKNIFYFSNVSPTPAHHSLYRPPITA